MPNEMLKERDIEVQYGLTRPWLRRARRESRGPTFLRIGRMVRYRRADIEEFLARHTVRPVMKKTAQTAQAG